MCYPMPRRSLDIAMRTLYWVETKRPSSKHSRLRHSLGHSAHWKHSRKGFIEEQESSRVGPACPKATPSRRKETTTPIRTYLISTLTTSASKIQHWHLYYQKKICLHCCCAPLYDTIPSAVHLCLRMRCVCSSNSTTTIVPKALIPESSEPVSKVEMSAATIAALRAMMRDERKHRFTNKLDRAIGDMKEKLKVETAARQQLEERILHLEQNSLKKINSTMDAGNEGEVDKAVAVVGGFVDKAIEEVETLVEEMMHGVHGYKEVEITDITPPLALATFDTPVQAMKFIRSQKKNATLQANKLSVSENRSRAERMRCKAISKIKKFLIELGDFEPSNITVNYKNFKVMARINAKLHPVANVTTDLGVDWLGNNIVNEAVRDAMHCFLSDLE